MDGFSKRGLMSSRTRRGALSPMVTARAQYDDGGEGGREGGRTDTTFRSPPLPRRRRPAVRLRSQDPQAEEGAEFCHSS